MRSLLIFFVIALVMLVPDVTQATTVTFSLTIRPIRMMIINDEGAIVDLISAVDESAADYELQARRNRRDGPVVTVTAGLFTAYRQYLERSSQSDTPSIARKTTLEEHPDGSWEELTSVVAI